MLVESSPHYRVQNSVDLPCYKGGRSTRKGGIEKLRELFGILSSSSPFSWWLCVHFIFILHWWWEYALLVISNSWNPYLNPKFNPDAFIIYINRRNKYVLWNDPECFLIFFFIGYSFLFLFSLTFWLAGLTSKMPGRLEYTSVLVLVKIQLLGCPLQDTVGSFGKSLRLWTSNNAS